MELGIVVGFFCLVLVIRQFNKEVDRLKREE